MKALLISLFATANLIAAQTFTYHYLDFVESSVSKAEDKWLYSYSFAPSEFSRHDISHVEIRFCKDASVSNHYSNVEYVPEFELGNFKFDDIGFYGQEQPETIFFSFESPNSPMVGSLFAKAATNIYEDLNVLVPSCQIPEPQAATLGLIGLTLLINRRKR